MGRIRNDYPQLPQRVGWVILLRNGVWLLNRPGCHFAKSMRLAPKFMSFESDKVRHPELDQDVQNVHQFISSIQPNRASLMNKALFIISGLLGKYYFFFTAIIAGSFAPGGGKKVSAGGRFCSNGCGEPDYVRERRPRRST